mgnify:CR=1 FL=1
MIKNYLDLLEWIRSPRNKNKDYSITLFQSLILQRLLKYSRQNQEITYSNQIISEHMFRGLSQIENNLPILTKKNLISTKVSRSKDEHGNIISKRVIRINWDKLQEIKTEMDEYLNQELVDDNSKDLTQENTQQEEPSDGIIYLEKKGKQYLVKNHQNIHLRYIGIGSQISLYFLDSNNRKENYTQTTKRKLNDYLDSSRKNFQDLTNSDLINLN